MSHLKQFAERIKEMEKAVKIGLALSAVLLGLPTWMVWSSSKDLQQIRMRTQAAQKKAIAMDGELRSLKQLASRKDRLALILERGGALSGLSRSLYKLGKHHNVNVTTMRAKDEPRVLGLRSGLNVSEQAFTGTCEGKYAELLGFFTDLSRSSRLVWLDSLEMTRGSGSEEVRLQVKFSGRVWTAAK